MGKALVVLAAGIGSRYGGLKQIEAVGPHGAIVIEYSVYDAIRAGFDRVVCVIRREIEADFRSLVASRFERHIPVDYVFQGLTGNLPAGFVVPEERKKPWGTAHAVLACADVVRSPFAVINADDFYGRRSFETLGRFLDGVAAGGTGYAMVGFTLRNTLSENGHVARGVCSVGADGMLRGVIERTKIEKDGHGARYADGETWRLLTGDEMVSMNMWGLTPSLFAHLRCDFDLFLKAHGGDSKAECYLPTVVDGLVGAGKATVRVLGTPESWFGVTYPQDKAVVVAGIHRLVEQGIYPERLWGNG
jgi:hypothetical protein